MGYIWVWWPCFELFGFPGPLRYVVIIRGYLLLGVAYQKMECLGHVNKKVRVFGIWGQWDDRVIDEYQGSIQLQSASRRKARQSSWKPHLVWTTKGQLLGLFGLFRATSGQLRWVPLGSGAPCRAHGFQGCAPLCTQKTPTNAQLRQGTCSNLTFELLLVLVALLFQRSWIG